MLSQRCREKTLLLNFYIDETDNSSSLSIKKNKQKATEELTIILHSSLKAKVQEALDNLMKADGSSIPKTVILVAHRLSTVMNADQVFGIIPYAAKDETIT